MLSRDGLTSSSVEIPVMGMELRVSLYSFIIFITGIRGWAYRMKQRSLEICITRAVCVLFVKDNGKINNSDFQTLNNVSKATATRDLNELVEKFRFLYRSGEVGAGTNYVSIGS